MTPEDIRALAAHIAPHTAQAPAFVESLIASFVEKQQASGCGDRQSAGAGHSIENRQALVDEIKGHVRKAGRNSPSFFENDLIALLLNRKLTPAQSQRLERYMERARGGTPRFAAWKDRRRDLRNFRETAIPGTELDVQAFLYSQGASARTFEWRGRSCLKSVYDIGIYLMLLSELRPRTIIELGGGAGGSALFFADMLKALDVDATIHVIDRDPAAFDVKRPEIHYHQGDCSEWMRMRAADPAGVDHPCVIIEDYHAADAETLIEAERILRPGDYLVIEDSLVKQDLIRQVLSRDTFQIDTQLTDFFGVNCTSAVNGILRRS